jgi:class 3 adenylate cyclase
LGEAARLKAGARRPDKSDKRTVTGLDPRHRDFDGLPCYSFSQHFGSVQNLQVDRFPSGRSLGAGEVLTESLAVSTGHNHCVEDLARWSSAPDYPWSLTCHEYEEFLRLIREDWASEHYIRGPGAGLGPDADQASVEAVARYMQAAASPSAVEAYERMNRDIDIRAILPAIPVPTLVMNRTGDPVAHVDAARDLAARIPNAQFKEYPGNSHPVSTKDMDVVLADIQMFLTGERPAERSGRRLAAVLFIDVVSSTEQLAKDGDDAWRNTLVAYYKLVRKEISRFQGEEFTVAGDGFLASFDGPARAVKCALAVSSTVKQLGIEVRAGVHVGECAIVDDNLTGIAVHTGARIMSVADAGTVWVSQTVKDLVSGSGLQFWDQGLHTLKGVPGEHRLFMAGLE